MSLRSSGSGSGHGGSSSSWSVGGLRVTSLDDISRYADAMVSFLDGGGDGSAEANHIAQGLKSEAEIAAYTLDEKLSGLDRLRYFLFHKNATSLQRHVGLDSLVRECTTAVIARPARAQRRGRHQAHARAASNALDGGEGSVARSVESALAYATALVSSSAAGAAAAAAQSAALPAAAAAAAAAPGAPQLVLTEQGSRWLEQLLPELHRAAPQWEWDLQCKLATLYSDMLTSRVFPCRGRLLEGLLVPFLLRMLEQEEMSEEYLAVWMQPLLAAIDLLGPVSDPQQGTAATAAAAAAAAASAPGGVLPASPLLHGAILDFSLKRGQLLSQPPNVRILCVHIWGRLAAAVAAAPAGSATAAAAAVPLGSPPPATAATLLSRVVPAVRSMCQDTSGAVRMHMARMLVPIVQALAATATTTAPGQHAHAAGDAVTAASAAAAAGGGDATASSSDPLSLLLSELEELLKDEEHHVRQGAFHALVSSLPLWPEHLRRTRCFPLLRALVATPAKGTMLLVAQMFPLVVWGMRHDLLPQVPDGHAHAGATAVDAQTMSLVRALISFYKNLPFLAATPTAAEPPPGLLSPVSAAMLQHQQQQAAAQAQAQGQHARGGSAGGGAGGGGGGGGGAFAAMLGQPFQPQGTVALASEPRRHCAASLVAVVSILGRVGAGASGNGGSGSGSSGGTAHSHSHSHSHPHSSSPPPGSAVGPATGPLVPPEARFFSEHLSALFAKLLRDEEAAVRHVAAASFFEVVNALGGRGSSITRGFVSRAHALAAKAWLAQGSGAGAGSGGSSAGNNHAHSNHGHGHSHHSHSHSHSYSHHHAHGHAHALPSSPSSSTLSLKKSSSAHGIVHGHGGSSAGASQQQQQQQQQGGGPAAAAAAPSSLPLLLQTAAGVAATLNTVSAFKLTKDAFFGIFHDHAAAVAAASAAASSSASGGPGPSGSGSGQGTGAGPGAGASSGTSNGRACSPPPRDSSGNRPGGGGGASPSETVAAASASVMLLIEGGKLEQIVAAYWRNHFGFVTTTATGAGSGTGAGTGAATSGGNGGGSGTPGAAAASAAQAQAQAQAQSAADAAQESWSCFMAELLRCLQVYLDLALSPGAATGSQGQGGYDWRSRRSFWAAVEFLFRPGCMAEDEDEEEGEDGPDADAVLLPRGTSRLRPTYLSSLGALHSGPDLSALSSVLDKFSTALLGQMHTGAAGLKAPAGDFYSSLMVRSPQAWRRADLLGRLVREFAGSRSFWDRAFFVQTCSRLLGVDGGGGGGGDAAESGGDEAGVRGPSPSLGEVLRAKPISDRLFKRTLFLPLVSLLSDPVALVRQKFLLPPAPRPGDASGSAAASGGLVRALRRMLVVPGDNALVDAMGRHLGAMRGALVESDRDGIAAVKALAAAVDGIPLRSEAAPHAYASAASAASAAAAGLVSPREAGERRREEFEESLLRGEEAWLAEERHRAALAQSGSNASMALAALHAAMQFTPLSFEGKAGSGGGTGAGGGGAGGSGAGSASLGGGGAGAGASAGVAGSEAKPLSGPLNKAKRASLGSNLKQLQDAVAAAEAQNSGGGGGVAASNARRKSFVGGGGMGLGTGSGGGAVGAGSASSSSSGPSGAGGGAGTPTAQQASALAASRVAAASKSKLKPNSTMLAAPSASSSSGSAGASSSGSGAAGGAAVAGASSGGGGAGASVGLLAPKAVRRYGSGAGAGAGSGAGASSPLLLSSSPPSSGGISSSAAAAAAAAASFSSSTAATVASILATKNNARTTVENLLNKASASVAMAGSGGGAGGSAGGVSGGAGPGPGPSPQQSPTAGGGGSHSLGMVASRQRAEFPSSNSATAAAAAAAAAAATAASDSHDFESDGSAAAPGGDLPRGPRKFSITSSSSSGPRRALGPGVGPGSGAGGSPAGAMAVSVPSSSSSSQTGVVRSSKLLSANLSVSAARIVAGSPPLGGGALSGPPVARTASPLTLAGGARPPRAGMMGRLPPQSGSGSGGAFGAMRDAGGGSLSDRSNERDSLGGGHGSMVHGSGSHGLSHGHGHGHGHHSHSNSSSSLPTALQLLHMGFDQQHNAHSHSHLHAHSAGSGASPTILGRRQMAVPGTHGAARAGPASGTGAGAAGSGGGAAPSSSYLPKLDSSSHGGGTGGGHGHGHAASASSSSSASNNSSSGSGAPSKLYSKEPLAHAHMRKFKMTQRSQLPSADVLRTETNLIKQDGAPLTGPVAAAHAAGMSGTGATLHSRRQGGPGAGFTAAKSSPRERK